MPKEQVSSKILITGSSGFLGNVFLSKLDSIYRVKTLRTSSNFQDFLKSLNSLKNEVFEYILICSSKPKQSVWHKEDIQELEMKIRLICEKLNFTRVIFLSSVDVYGSSPKLPLTEDSTLSSQSLYAECKIRLESLLKQILFENQLMIIRLPGVFGGSTKSHGMLDRFVRSLRVNQPIRIHNSEVLHVLRDWVYSDDVANFIAFSLNNFSHGIYNFATGKSIPIIQYIHMAELITKNEALILSEELKLPDGIYDLVFDTHKLSEYLIDFSFTNFSLYSFPK